MKDCTGLAGANSLKLRPSFATIKTVKPYNSTHTRCRQECVFAEGKFHRSICLFTFCAFHKLLQRRAENVKPYNRTQARCHQECVLAEGKSHRSICLFTFCALHKILRRCAKYVKPYNRTHTGTRQECIFAEGKVTVVYVSLLSVLCTKFCKDAPKM